MTPPHWSTALFWRRARALALVAGFWLIGLALPVITALMVARVLTDGILFFLLGAFILWGLLLTFSFYKGLLSKPPAPQTFLPAIAVNEGEAPELFTLIRAAAAETRFRKPFEIRAALTAAVIGYRSRLPSQPRVDVIQLGLPALAFLTPDDLRILVTHTFNGLRSRDPIFLSLAATRRTLSRFIDSRNKLSALLARPFVKPADHLFAEEQEASKGLIAGTIGAEPVSHTFALHTGVLRLFDQFWKTDMQIVLSSGHVPPVIEGFQDRCENLRGASAKDMPPVPEPCALNLFRSPETVENKFVGTWIKANPALQTISWELAGSKVLVPMWSKQVNEVRQALVGLRVRDLHEAVVNGLAKLGRAMFQKPGSLLAIEQLEAQALRVITLALTLALQRNGWELVYRRAGDPIALGRDSVLFRPDIVLRDLKSGKFGAGEWMRQSDALGISDFELAPPAVFTGISSIA